MRRGEEGGATRYPELRRELKDVVMGLHWDPPHESGAGDTADLDALCVLFDAKDRILEIVHPGHPSNCNGSVIHTGDSRTGASAWDDERVFVFLDAIPEAVHRLDFIVASASGQPFHEVPGAQCHVSDAVSESQWLRRELTSLVGHTEHAVARLHRRAASWTIAAENFEPPQQVLESVRQLVRAAKCAPVTPLRTSPRPTQR